MLDQSLSWKDFFFVVSESQEDCLNHILCLPLSISYDIGYLDISLIGDVDWHSHMTMINLEHPMLRLTVQSSGCS